jgi:hypothetical protein
MKLVGANPRAKVTGLDQLPGKSNYFIGNDPKKWRTNVPNYAKVRYANVYPGVDLVYYGNQGQLEYDFVVQPGSDPRQIALDVGVGLAPPERAPQAHDRAPEGQSAIDNRKSSMPRPLRIAANGDLVVGTDGGKVIFHKPVVYQPETNDRQMTKDQGRGTKDGGKHFVDGRYVLRSDQSVAFQVASYDFAKPLVIDPVLAYSTYLGGSSFEEGFGIAVGVSGSAYITGDTFSSDFPTTPGAFQTISDGSQNAFVVKLNSSGSALVYSTYLGGSDDDEGDGLAVDASGNAYVTGGTWSSDFPTTPGAFQTTLKGLENAFVTKLNATGSALVYSTYLGGSVGGSGGGSGIDEGRGIAVGVSGSAYITGDTDSSDFPTTPGAFQAIFGGFDDAFVVKLNPSGSALVYSTYLGGSDDDEGDGLAVDASGNAYVTGSTDSSDFPTTPGAFQDPANQGAFVTKLNAAGSALVYSTSSIGGGGIALDASGNAYVTGYTNSSNFPTTPGSFQITYGGSFDAFVSKLNTAGSALLYSTYLGGSGFELGLGIAVDASGNADVTGTTGSNDFPTTPGAFQTTCGGGSCYDEHAFVTKLNAAGSALLYSTYLGGSESDGIPTDRGRAVAVDASGSAYVTGFTQSSNFPVTPGAFQTSYGGGDAFAAKIGPSGSSGVALAPFGLAFPAHAVGSTSAPQKIQLWDTSSTQTLAVTSIAANGDFAQTNTCGSAIQPGVPCTLSVTFTPTATGTRTGTLTITDNAAGSPQQLPLTGTGGGEPRVRLTSARVSFPVLRTVETTSLAYNVKLTNVGSAELDVTRITFTGPNSGDFAQSNNCTPAVAPGASCLITLTFKPTAQGVRTASVSIADSASGSPQTVPLTGRGTFFQWSPRQINMGNQAVGTSSAARTVTLTNVGPTPIALFSIGIGGVNPGDFSETNTCGSSLKAGASCTIEVTFNPTAVGSRLGHVAIQDSAFGGTHVVGLLGKGT